MKRSTIAFSLSALLMAVLVAAILACTQPAATPSTPPPSTSAPAPATTPASPAPAAKAIELSYASMHAPGSDPAKQIDRWTEKIKAASNGQLTIRHYPSSTLIAGPDMREGIKAGTADLGNSFIYKPDPEFEVGQYLTQLVRGVSMATGVKIFDEIWAKYPDLMASQWKSYKLLWIVPSVPTVFYTVKKPIRTMEDFKGMQIRVPNKILSDMMLKLGATPVSMSTPDWIVSLDKGTTDGACTTVASLFDFKIGEKLKYCTVYPMGSSVNFLIMNKDSWNKLSPDLQKVIDNSLPETKKDVIDTWTQIEVSTSEYAQKSGIQKFTVSPEEYAKWDAAIKPVCDDIAKALDSKNYPGTELVNFSMERSAFYAKQ